jgi:hypothetical protein
MDAAPDDYNEGATHDLLLEFHFTLELILALAGMKEM